MPKEALLLRKELHSSTNYESWKNAAEKLDVACGNNRWKENPKSHYYDYKLLGTRKDHIVALAKSGDASSLMFLLRAGLIRNLGGLSNPKLFTFCNIGSKYLIESYIDEVTKNFYNLAQLQDEEITFKVKLEYFMDLQQSFGKTALLFTGGGAFGMMHLGVAKALFENNLLPRIICGSSIGGLVASLIGVCSNEELDRLFHSSESKINLEAFEKRGEGGMKRKIVRFFKHGYLMDIHVLEAFVQDNVGDLTFLEAYLKTRRILNILVSSARQFESPILLNYLTAPDILIRTAACASCSIPGIYDSVELLAKNSKGDIYSWYPPSSVKWKNSYSKEGKQATLSRLTELFNVNNFIVSEMNPSAIPLYKSTPGHGLGCITKCLKFVTSELRHRLFQLRELGLLPAFLSRIQKYFSTSLIGDIIIFPVIELSDLHFLFNNPTRELIKEAMLKGEKATWPYLNQIMVRCAIEFAIDDILQTHLKSSKTLPLDFLREKEKKRTKSIQ